MPFDARSKTGMQLPRGWAWHMLLLTGAAAVLLLLGPYVLMIGHSSNPDAATVATTSTLEVDPEDLREGAELDVPAVWKAANAEVGQKYSLGQGAKGLYTPPEATRPSAVIELFSNETATLIAAHDVPSVIVFYSSWCGHCRHYAPKFDKLARHFVTKYDVVFAAVNCPDQGDACNAQSVGAYPTVKLFNWPGLIPSWDRYGQEVDIGNNEAIKRLVSGHAHLRSKLKLVAGQARGSSLRGASTVSSTGTDEMAEHWLEGRLGAAAFAATPRARLHDGLASLKYLLADEFPVAMSEFKRKTVHSLVARVLAALPRTAEYAADLAALQKVEVYLFELNYQVSSTTIRNDISKIIVDGGVPWAWNVCGVDKAKARGRSTGSIATSFTCGVWQLFHFLSVAPSIATSHYVHGTSAASAGPSYYCWRGVSDRVCV